MEGFPSFGFGLPVSHSLWQYYAVELKYMQDESDLWYFYGWIDEQKGLEWCIQLKVIILAPTKLHLQCCAWPSLGRYLSVVSHAKAGVVRYSYSSPSGGYQYAREARL